MTSMTVVADGDFQSNRCYVEKSGS